MFMQSQDDKRGSGTNINSIRLAISNQKLMRNLGLRSMIVRFGKSAYKESPRIWVGPNSTLQNRLISREMSPTCKHSSGNIT